MSEAIQKVYLPLLPMGQMTTARFSLKYEHCTIAKWNPDNDLNRRIFMRLFCVTHSQ